MKITAVVLACAVATLVCAVGSEEGCRLQRYSHVLAASAEHHPHHEESSSGASGAFLAPATRAELEELLVAAEEAHHGHVAGDSAASFLNHLAQLPRAELHSGEPIRLGSGRHIYEWVTGWCQLPADMQLGNTHGAVLVNAAGEVLVNTDSRHAVMVFERAGKFLRSLAPECAGGAHGMVTAAEGKGEVLWLAHTARHEVLKLDADGKVLQTLAWPEASGHYAKKEQFHPTSVAVAPDGSVFVADGYGLSWVHHYAADGRWLRAFGGPGSEPGQMRTPHGLLLDTRTTPPTLLVADRENHRLQRFDLEGKLLKVINGDLRRPCKMSLHAGDLAVADLAGRVTILDKDDKLVTHLGDQPDTNLRANNGVPRELWKDGEFLAPHGLTFDQDGNLYIMDWLALGRVTKLQRVK
jgi:sugar lactone lactonase YvrE